MNVTNEHKTKTVQAARTTDPTVPQSDVPDGVRALQGDLGSKIPPISEGQTSLATTPPAALVSAQRSFASVRASNSEGGAKTVASIEPLHAEGLAARAEEIDALYEPDDTADPALPQAVYDTTRQWLRAHDLIWSSNDPAFWNALAYVLDSLESFSIDAVEQALIICTTEAFDDPARRSMIYQELKACRALKKIRDMQIRIRTAQVVATRTLSAPHALVIRQQRELAALEFDAQREISQAYVVYQRRENYETQQSRPHTTLPSAQNEARTMVDDPDRIRLDGFDPLATIHRVGLNAEGKIIRDYGVVATVKPAPPKTATVKTGFANFDQKAGSITE